MHHQGQNIILTNMSTVVLDAVVIVEFIVID
jgi:hypothetical protein